MPFEYIFPTVMLMDDSRIDNPISKKVLEREAMANQVVLYTNSAEALDYSRRIDADQVTDEALIPALIFVDLDMPEMIG